MADPVARLRTSLADRYRLEGEIGRGGMATVYLAHDLKHDRPVAIKVLHPELAAALGPERFQREIKLAARLQHPHILSVHDSGEAAGQLWFTMPFVEGESLRDRLNREKQLPVEDALRIACEAAEALDYAHRHGVVHRDLKPENILLVESYALLADFGIARALGGAEQPLTGTGIAVGTPAYMSPEQASGSHDLDARTDVYALGCVLYEMLVGEPPYTGPSAQAIMAKSVTDPVPSARRLRNTIPLAVDAAIGRALARIPADRFATAIQFAEALTSAPATMTTQQSVAVLPFANMSPDAENEYFADGMTDEIINVLTQIGDLRVAARTSSFAFKGKDVNIRTIAEELQVATVLEGSVRKAGNRLRITVQLSNAADGYHLWSQQYDREIHDVFAIQDEIARAIADRLKVTLSGQRRIEVLPPPTQDLEAYQLYLKGRYFWVRRDGESLPKAIEYFSQAITRDPGFAAAHAGLADSYLVLGLYGYLPPWEILDKTRLGVERAIAHDETSADGHLALGHYELFFGWHFDVAEREFRRAAELAPSRARAFALLSHVAALRGLTSATLVAARQAQALEPLSPLIYAITGVALLIVGALDEALEAVHRALELEPTFFTALWCAGMVYEGKGRPDEAISAYEVAVTHSRRSPLILAFLGLSYARAGRSPEARALAVELEQRGVGDFYPGLIYWGLGEEERAFALLAHGLEQRAAFAWMVGLLPGNEMLGGDPRWIALLESVGLGSLAERLRPQAARSDPIPP